MGKVVAFIGYSLPITRDGRPVRPFDCGLGPLEHDLMGG